MLRSNPNDNTFEFYYRIYLVESKKILKQVLCMISVTVSKSIVLLFEHL